MNVQKKFRRHLAKSIKFLIFSLVSISVSHCRTALPAKPDRASVELPVETLSDTAKLYLLENVESREDEPPQAIQNSPQEQKAHLLSYAQMIRDLLVNYRNNSLNEPGCENDLDHGDLIFAARLLSLNHLLTAIEFFGSELAPVSQSHNFKIVPAYVPLELLNPNGLRALVDSHASSHEVGQELPVGPQMLWQMTDAILSVYEREGECEARLLYNQVAKLIVERMIELHMGQGGGLEETAQLVPPRNPLGERRFLAPPPLPFLPCKAGLSIFRSIRRWLV
ncbi:MAG: hypothetical protein HYW48_11840 [Deltaproteobacteria bacterium]|nr:hypothetical protein [Deltaproteobacteria bacterium]